MRRAHLVAPVFLLAAAARVPAQASRSREPAEVRQLVTFLFRPGLADSARAIYLRELRPAYAADSALRRFRAYREAESPVPLDLVVVSSFAGMAGMDASNAALRRLASGGRTVFQWYGVLSALSQHHRDDFVEMLPALGDPVRAAADTGAGLTVFEYVRLVPGGQGPWERLVGSRARDRERAQGVLAWSETGRLLVADGWDYVRFHGIRSLADWQAHAQGERDGRYGGELARLVVARKVVIVRQDPELVIR